MKTYYLYLITSGLHTKIGIAQDLEKRLNQISTCCPEKPSLFCFFGPVEFQKALDAETYYHYAFNKKNTHREWYLLDIYDVEQIQNSLDRHIDEPLGYWRQRRIECEELWNIILEEQKCHAEDF